MTQNPSTRSLSPELAKQVLTGFGISETAYAINNDFNGIKIGENLRLINDSTLARTAGVKPLNFSLPEGFVVVGIYKNLSTGLDAFMAANTETRKIQIGVAGTNGFGKDNPDTKEDVIYIGAKQAKELHLSEKFRSDLRNTINSFGGIHELDNILIAGQSLGGVLATSLGQLLMFRSSRAKENDFRYRQTSLPLLLLTHPGMNTPAKFLASLKPKQLFIKNMSILYGSLSVTSLQSPAIWSLSLVANSVAPVTN